MDFGNGILTPTEPALDLVRILSEGTYTSFPQALKEFISNSFDSDAARVDIRIDEGSNGITIRDTGDGMTLKDFGEAFASIARSGATRRGVKRGRTKSGRVKIGRFGIGTLAVVAICDRFSVTSTRIGSSEGFTARMDVTKLRKHFGKGDNLSDHWKFEAEKWTTERTATHFTEIRLEGLPSQIRSLLERPGERKLDEAIESIKQLSGADQLAWHLGLISPVAYAHDYPIPKTDLNPTKDTLLIKRARRLLRDRFTVSLNGRPVLKQILLPQYKIARQRNAEEFARLTRRGLGYEVTCFRSPRGAPVRYEGYVVVQAQQLFPEELRGLMVRLRGVGIGSYSTLHLTGGSISTMLPTMSGEIWVENGLEDALQFDRESFREDHASYIYFREQIRKIIEEQAKGFRKRSQTRIKIKKAAKAPSSRKKEPAKAAVTKPIRTAAPAELFIDPEIFKDCPDFINYLIPQINGCWDREWREACALTVRRLLETLIIHLYEERGWANEIRDVNGYKKLQNLVDKVCGDGRVGLGKNAKAGLNHLKAFGDVAAHDYRVRVRKSDLENRRNDFRLACERLIFIAQN